MSLSFQVRHRVHTVVRMEIQQHAFQLRYLPKPRLMHFRKSIDCFDSFSDALELFVRYDIAFVDYDNIRV